MHPNVRLSFGLVNWIDINKAWQLAVQKGNGIISGMTGSWIRNCSALWQWGNLELSCMTRSPGEHGHGIAVQNYYLLIVCRCFLFCQDHRNASQRKGNYPPSIHLYENPLSKPLAAIIFFHSENLFVNLLFGFNPP